MATGSRTPAAAHPADAASALMTGSAASNQLGAATAALAFPALGPAGVVAVRQWVAGVVLLVTVRPKFASFTRRQWGPVLALALIFAVMNLSLYTAIDRIGLGLAVTLEFLGPLSVALLASRRVIDLGVRPDRRGRRGRAGEAAAEHRLRRHRAGAARGRLLGRLHPGEPGGGRPAAGCPGARAAAGLSALLYIPVGIWALGGQP